MNIGADCRDTERPRDVSIIHDTFSNCAIDNRVNGDRTELHLPRRSLDANDYKSAVYPHYSPAQSLHIKLYLASTTRLLRRVQVEPFPR